MIITTDDFNELGFTQSNKTTIARLYPYKRNRFPKEVPINSDKKVAHTRTCFVYEYDYDIVLNIVEEKTRSIHARQSVKDIYEKLKQFKGK